MGRFGAAGTSRVNFLVGVLITVLLVVGYNLYSTMRRAQLSALLLAVLVVWAMFHHLKPSHRAELYRLKSRGLPSVLLQLVALVQLLRIDGAEGNLIFDAVEFFAGQGAVTLALQLRFLRAVSYERDADGCCEDIMSATGYGYAISLIMRLAPGSLVWLRLVI